MVHLYQEVRTTGLTTLYDKRCAENILAGQGLSVLVGEDRYYIEANFISSWARIGVRWLRVLTVGPVAEGPEEEGPLTRANRAIGELNGGAIRQGCESGLDLIAQGSLAEYQVHQKNGKDGSDVSHVRSILVT